MYYNEVGARLKLTPSKMISCCKRRGLNTFSKRQTVTYKECSTILFVLPIEFVNMCEVTKSKWRVLTHGNQPPSDPVQ